MTRKSANTSGKQRHSRPKQPAAAAAVIAMEVVQEEAQLAPAVEVTLEEAQLAPTVEVTLEEAQPAPAVEVTPEEAQPAPATEEMQEEVSLVNKVVQEEAQPAPATTEAVQEEAASTAVPWHQVALTIAPAPAPVAAAPAPKPAAKAEAAKPAPAAKPKAASMMSGMGMGMPQMAMPQPMAQFTEFMKMFQKGEFPEFKAAMACSPKEVAKAAENLRVTLKELNAIWANCGGKSAIALKGAMELATTARTPDDIVKVQRKMADIGVSLISSMMAASNLVIQATENSMAPARKQMVDMFNNQKKR